MPNGQSQVRGEILVLKLESAGLKKVDIKAHTTSRLYGASLCIIQYVKYNTVHTCTYQYILVQTSMYGYVHLYTNTNFLWFHEVSNHEGKCEHEFSYDLQSSLHVPCHV